MKKFFSFIIRQSVAIVLAVVLVAAFGVYSTMRMPINLLPDINVPMVCVQVIYPGANAQTVEEDVTGKLEDGLSAIAGVNAVDSYSYDNLSAIVLSFDYGTDTGEKQTEITNKLSSIDLPDEITIDVYDIDLNAEALAVLSVTSEDGLESAYRSAQELAARLSAIDGVENVEIKGGAEKVWAVRPFGGLELTAPLFVQAFSYGALDIPLGDLKDVMGSVQIKNNSKITTADDILNMPISLPASVASSLSGVERIAGYYRDCTAEDLLALQTDLDGGVSQVLAQIDSMPSPELDDMATLNTYIFLGSLPSSVLETILSSSLYGDLYDRTFKTDGDGNVVPKPDDELEELADEINGSTYANFIPFEVTVEFLRVIQNGKLGEVKSFRDEIEQSEEYLNSTYYTLTDNDCLKLARQVMYQGDTPSDEILLERIDFVRKTSSAGLSNIAAKKREAEAEGAQYVPTDSECVRLFVGTRLSVQHPIILSTEFMGFFRAESFSRNMEVLVEKRQDFGENIDADEYFELYQSLDLTGLLELKLSRELINFIMTTDLTALSESGELVVAVKDIATVSEEEQYSSFVYFGDGATPEIIAGTTIEVYKSNGANSSAVVSRVKEVYAQYLNSASGIKIELLDDQSQFISESISNVLISMLIGGVLAVIVIFVFLKKVKTSLIIAVTMPLSVLASMICLSLAGITLNMVSLGGLAVGIGMLVDNSIVVIESISKHRDLDKTAFQAAVDGTTEVGGALFGSTLTTVCVFIPIIFAGGLTGEIFTDLSFAVIFSLTLSLVVAVTVIPALYAMLCKKDGMLKGGRLKKFLSAESAIASYPQAECTARKSDGECTEKEEKTQHVPQKTSKKFKLSALKEPRIMDGITSFYGKLLPKVLKRKIIPILTAIIIFGASIGLLFLTGTEFLPSIDKGQIEITASYESGTSLEDIKTDVSLFADKIEEEFNDNLEYISVSVGKHGMLALTDTGIIKVQLKTNRGTAKSVDKIRQIAESGGGFSGRRGLSVKEIDGVVASLMSGADDLSVTVLGEDNDTLVRIAGDVIERLEADGFKDVKSSAADKEWQTDIRFDRAALSEFGLDYQTLVLTLRIGIASYTACTAVIDGEQCSVNVSFDNNSLSDINSLRDFTVGFDSSGKTIKLYQVAEVSDPYEVDACIRRSDGKKMISVSAVLPGVDTGTAGARMQEIAAGVLENYNGYSFQQSGISSYLSDAFRGLAVALVVSFFLLYAVMAVQFGSALKPLIIMASIPFSFTGGFLALVITGSTLNVVSFIGLIMLMGVVVNNAIVMLEKIKQLHDDGMPHFEAVTEACKVRLRPIFMTTLTTILALIPLAIGVGQGSELMQPLGIVVIGGLLIGTLVTLVLIPAVYCAIHRISQKHPNGKKN